LEVPLIIQAAKQLNWTLVKGFARLGHDIFVNDTDGWGLAHYAVVQGNLNMLKWIIESASESSQWQTCCMSDTRSSEDRIRKQTLSDTEVSLLHLGSLVPHILTYMLENNFFGDLDITTYNGRTPMHFAAFRGSKYRCQILISRGANPCIRDKSGNLPIDYAHFHDYREVVTLLLEADSPQPQEQFTEDNYIDYMVYTTKLEMLRRVEFEKAIWNGDLADCERARLAKCSVDRPVPACLCSPLFLAIRARQELVVTWLLKQGASTLNNKCHHNVQTELVAHAMSYMSSVACLKSILTASFEQQTIWHTGLSMAIYIAVGRNKPELVKTILEHFDLHIKEYQ
jgi:ankyrin repeat protein